MWRAACLKREPWDTNTTVTDRSETKHKVLSAVKLAGSNGSLCSNPGNMMLLFCGQQFYICRYSRQALLPHVLAQQAQQKEAVVVCQETREN